MQIVERKRFRSYFECGWGLILIVAEEVSDVRSTLCRHLSTLTTFILPAGAGWSQCSEKSQNPQRKNWNKTPPNTARLKVRGPWRQGKKLGPGSCYFQTKGKTVQGRPHVWIYQKVFAVCCSVFFKLRTNKKAPGKLVNFSPVIWVTLWSGTLPRLRRNAKRRSGLAEWRLFITQCLSAVYILVCNSWLPGASELVWICFNPLSHWLWTHGDEKEACRSFGKWMC